MKKALLLFLLFALPVQAQSITDWWTRSGNFYPIDATDFTNTLTWQLANNTAGGLTWKWTASNGSANQVLITDGASPATLTWASLSSILPTDIVITDPATTGRNTILPVNSSTVGISSQAYSSGTSHLMDYQNTGGSVIAYVDHSGAALFHGITNNTHSTGVVTSDVNGLENYTSGFGTSGQVLTSTGSSTQPSFQTLAAGVTSFSAGTTGFTPNSATTGAITLAGTLAVANGGTGVTSAGANRLFATVSSGGPSFQQISLGNTNYFLVNNYLPTAYGGTGSDLSTGSPAHKLVTGGVGAGLKMLTSTPTANDILIANGTGSDPTWVDGTGLFVKIAPSNTSDNNVIPIGLAVPLTLTLNSGDASDDIQDWQDGTATAVAFITHDGTFGANKTLIGDYAGASVPLALVASDGSGNQANFYVPTLSTVRRDTIPDYSGRVIVANEPATAGLILKANGAGLEPSWQSAGGSGTVTSIATSAPISGGTITTTGTISFDYSFPGVFTGVQDMQVNALATTTSGILECINQTNATSGAPIQVSPALDWQAMLWNTTATAATNKYLWREWLNGTSAASPTGIFTAQFNNFTVDNAWTTAYTVTSAGNGKGATLTLPLSNIATTVTNALLIQNTTASTSGVKDQYSATLELDGGSWNGSANQKEKWRIYNKTINSGTPTSLLMFDYSVNGGAFSNAASISSSNTGIFDIAGGFTIAGAAPNNQVLIGNGTYGAWGTIGVANLSGLTSNSVMTVNNSGAIAFIANVTANRIFVSNGTTSAPTWLAPGAAHTYLHSDGSTISYTADAKDFTTSTSTSVIGDMPYVASTSATKWTPLAAASSGKVLTAAGVGTAPAWKVNVGGMILGQSTTIPNTTRYVYPNGQGTLSATLTTSTEFVAPVACLLQNLYVAASAAAGTAQSTTVTVYVNGSAGNETVTISDPNTSGTDGANTDALNPGDLVTIQIVTSLTSAATTLTYGIQLTSQ